MLVYFHYVCLSCRRCAKRQPLSCYEEYIALKCAQCGVETTPVGKHFTAPKRRDDAGWKKLAWMIENGWRGGSWPIAPEMNLNQVRESLRTARAKHVAICQRVNEEYSFKEVVQRARHNARNRRKAMARKNARSELEAQQKYQDAVLARVQSEN